MLVAGARPQFIKLAMLTDSIKDRFDQVIVHTGQHFDHNMSEIFFEELGINSPDYNLGISGGSHAQMVAHMMIKLEEVMLKELPDAVVVVGDTNTTLAGALTAAKLYIPLVHVEAGARTHNKTNPEELNRICTDHLSTLRFASTMAAMEELNKENITYNSYFSGNTMYDAFLKYCDRVKTSELQLRGLDGSILTIPDKYYYMTCHREENTGDPKDLTEILKAMNSLDAYTIYPAHPRNRKKAQEIVRKKHFSKILLCEPVGYFESLALIQGCEKVVTDSGGLQTEAFFARKKCVTVLDFICWPETLSGKRNEHAKPDAQDIISKLSNPQIIDESYKPFGDGHAAEKIIDILFAYLTNERTNG